MNARDNFPDPKALHLHTSAYVLKIEDVRRKNDIWGVSTVDVEHLYTFTKDQSDWSCEQKARKLSRTHVYHWLAKL